MAAGFLLLNRAAAHGEESRDEAVTREVKLVRSGVERRSFSKSCRTDPIGKPLYSDRLTLADAGPPRGM